MKFVFGILLFVVSLRGYAARFPPNVKYLPDMMANATVRLDVEKPIGRWTGTGFLYVFRKHNDWTKCIYTVLTTRSFLRDAKSVSFSLPLCGTDYRATGERVSFAYAHDEMRVYSHPDSDVDLCALAIKPDEARFGDDGVPHRIAILDSSILADEGYYTSERQLDPVVMVGFPEGLEDSVGLQPIFRRGVYATNPSCDYKGKKEFLLDIPNHGGSAGSPVFRYDEGVYQDRASSCANITLGTRLTLVGVSFDGSCVCDSRTPCVVIAGVNNSMARVMKATRIRELDNMLNEKYGKQ